MEWLIIRRFALNSLVVISRLLGSRLRFLNRILNLDVNRNSSIRPLPPIQYITTYMFLFLIQSFLLLHRCLISLAFIYLVCAWCTLKVFESFIPENDGLFDDIVQEDLVMRC